jgi:hypothetical protein
MAIGDYILCCECECKLIYDGDRGQREWWHDRWGKDPQIKCPDCNEWQGLTDDEIEDIHCTPPRGGKFPFARMIEAKLKEKNT